MHPRTAGHQPTTAVAAERIAAAIRGELGGFRHPGLLRASSTGLIEPWGAYTLGNVGIIFSSGAFVALVSSLNPVVVALLAAPILGERVKGIAVLLMVVSIAGVSLVIGGGGLDGSIDPLGVLFAVLGLFCGAFYTLLSSRLVRSAPIIPLVALQLLVAALASFVVLIVPTVSVSCPETRPTVRGGRWREVSAMATARWRSSIDSVIGPFSFAVPKIRIELISRSRSWA